MRARGARGSLNGWNRVLVLAPHTDDGEFAAGGTIARLREAGAEVRYVALSTGSPPPEPQTLLAEVEAACGVLGLETSALNVLGFEARSFPAQRQEILDLFVGLAAEMRPDVVLAPSGHDVHQDHGVVHAEALRAFKHSTILGYEEPWNNYRFAYQAFVALETEHLRKKLRALAQYRSQTARPYADPSYIEALARTHGVRAGCAYAEAFEVCRLIV